MSKRSSKDPVDTNAGAERALKHNPFAALSAQRAELPAGEAPKPTPEAVRSPAESTKSRGRVVLARETKHRGGKPVILVRGLEALRDFDRSEADKLAKELKQKLGCGGTVEHEANELRIVLQGDHPAKVAELLRAKGFRVDGVTR